jgi:hypothetical protein
MQRYHQDPFRRLELSGNVTRQQSVRALTSGIPPVANPAASATSCTRWTRPAPPTWDTTIEPIPHITIHSRTTATSPPAGDARRTSPNIQHTMQVAPG